MTDTTIHCPNCGTEIPISAVLGAQIRADVEARVKHDQEQRLRDAVTGAEKRARAQADSELALVREQLVAQAEKARTAQQAELELRKQKALLEERALEIDLEVARRVDGEKARLEEGIRKAVGEEQGLKLLEKEKQIDDLRRALDDARRRTELGSQELQGEVLELDIQAELERLFPHDRITPVPKGTRGADIMQTVIDDRMQSCGAIAWEAKNTKAWNAGWLAKLKDDQRANGAAIAVLVSVALPDGIEGFGRIDGVWVCGLKTWPALARVLREQLIQVAFAHAAAEGKSEKMDLLYRYLAGDQFRQRVQGIVEGFMALQTQVQSERRAMERQWKEREKQIERVMINTTGLYGEMRGIVGAGIPPIQALELDDTPLLEDGGGPDGM